MRILNTLPYRASMTNMPLTQGVASLAPATRFWAFSPCIIGGTSTIQASLIVFGLHDNSARALSAAKLCRKNIDFENIKAVNNQRVRKE